MNASLLAKRRELTASLMACALIAPGVAGCGTNGNNSGATGSAGSMSRPAPGGYGGQTYGGVPAPQQQRRGMSTGQKVALLAGAAALAYMYNRQKNAKGTGAQGQYYRSRNGRVYYRDQKGNAVYVTPPAGGIQVPAEVAQQYNRAAQNPNFNFDDPSLDLNNFGGGGNGGNGGNYGAAAPAYGNGGGGMRGNGY